MKISGRIEKEGKFWAVYIPILDGMTQGRTRKEALEMAVDLVRCMLEEDNFPLTGTYTSKLTFELSSDLSAVLVALALRQQRLKSGLSASQVAQRMGQTSANAYYRFEKGYSSPTLGMLDRLFRAVGATADVALAL